MKFKQLLIYFFVLTISGLKAQDTTENISLALNAGNTKELLKYFSKSTEVKIDNEGRDYTIAQAEPIIRDFFRENPPSTFEYIHKGESPQGLKYNIGQYKSNSKTFRIVLFLKKSNDQYLIDTISFNRQ